MKKELIVFAVILIGIDWLLKTSQIPYADEVWLISGLFAAHIVYLIRPERDENYAKITGPVLLMVLGAYVVVLKAPILLSALINYRLAQLLCLAIYASFGWLLIKKRRLTGLKSRRNL